jgi:serine/threonine protein kinase
MTDVCVAEDALTSVFSDGVVSAATTPVKVGLNSTLGRFTLLRRVGSGSFATVWKAQIDHIPGKSTKNGVFALKVFDRHLRSGDGDPSPADAKESQDDCILEVGVVAALSVLPHAADFIIPLQAYGFDTVTATNYIVFPFEASQTVHDFMVRPRGFLAPAVRMKMNPRSMDTVRWIAHGLLRALEFIHRAGIIHRDIGPANVFVTPEGVRVSDFGLAMNTSNKPDIDYVVGRWYRPPEILLRTGVQTPAIDIWSAGLLLLFVFVGTHFVQGSNTGDQMRRIAALIEPFPEKLLARASESRRRLYASVQPQEPRHSFLDVLLSIDAHVSVTSDERAHFAAFLETMLVPDPLDRASARDLMQHTFSAQLHPPT